MAKKKSASSPREERLPASALFTSPVGSRERAEFERRSRTLDSKIDYSDAPVMKPLPADVYVGRFYRPVKQQISIRVDADVLAWFRSRGKEVPNLHQRSLAAGNAGSAKKPIARTPVTTPPGAPSFAPPG
jgi:uncharacterized protein (DUF4415 family)